MDRIEGAARGRAVNAELYCRIRGAVAARRNGCIAGCPHAERPAAHWRVTAIAAIVEGVEVCKEAQGGAQRAKKVAETRAGCHARAKPRRPSLRSRPTPLLLLSHPRTAPRLR